jgi:hypothetical protein
MKQSTLVLTLEIPIGLRPESGGKSGLDIAVHSNKQSDERDNELARSVAYAVLVAGYDPENVVLVVTPRAAAGTEASG